MLVEVSMKEDKQEKKEKIHVSTMLFQYEKKWLKFLAEESGRSMSKYLQYLLREAIDNRR